MFFDGNSIYPFISKLFMISKVINRVIVLQWAYIDDLYCVSVRVQACSRVCLTARNVKLCEVIANLVNKQLLIHNSQHSPVLLYVRRTFTRSGHYFRMYTKNGCEASDVFRYYSNCNHFTKNLHLSVVFHCIKTLAQDWQ